MDENLIRGLFAVVGAASGALITRWLNRPREKRVAAAIFLEAICASLQGMIDSFSKGQMPHRYGHAFVAALEAFRPIVEPAIGADAFQHLSNLQHLAREALAIDGEIVKNNLPPESWSFTETPNQPCNGPRMAFRFALASRCLLYWLNPNRTPL